MKNRGATLASAYGLLMSPEVPDVNGGLVATMEATRLGKRKAAFGRNRGRPQVGVMPREPAMG